MGVGVGVAVVVCWEGWGWWLWEYGEFMVSSCCRTLFSAYPLGSDTAYPLSPFQKLLSVISYLGDKTLPHRQPLNSLP